MWFNPLILLQKYDIYHIIIRILIKKPQTILKVLLALFFITYTFYFCSRNFPNQVWSTTIYREALHFML